MRTHLPKNVLGCLTTHRHGSNKTALIVFLVFIWSPARGMAAGIGLSVCFLHMEQRNVVENHNPIPLLSIVCGSFKMVWIAYVSECYCYLSVSREWAVFSVCIMVILMLLLKTSRIQWSLFMSWFASTTQLTLECFHTVGNLKIIY